MALFGNDSSRGITVGDHPLLALDARMARNPGDRALTREQRDWLLVRSVLQPGERPWSRVAVRFPEQNNVSGHLFLTDQRLLFEYREKVLSIGLAYIDYLGRPSGLSQGDFVVEAPAPNAYGGSRFAMVIRVKDTEAFHDFFPTLLAAVRATGAQPEVDHGWPRAATASVPAAGRPAAADRATGGRKAAARHAEDLVQQVLTRLLRSAESVVVSAEMIHNLGGDPVKVLITDQRLVVVDASVVWAAELRDVKLIDGQVAMAQLRLLVQAEGDVIALGATAPRRAMLTQRLVLRAGDDENDTERLRRHLARHAGGVLAAWPPDRNPS